MTYRVVIERVWEKVREQNRVEKPRQARRKREPVRARGQMDGMFRRVLGNVTARVRNQEGKTTNQGDFSRNAVGQRRFIVETTIEAFPMVPLLQQARILHRRPRRGLKRCTKDSFQSWATRGHMHTYTYTNAKHFHKSTH